MKNFEFNWDPEKERRRKKFPQQISNFNLLLDDNSLVIKNLENANKDARTSIEKVQNWTIKNM
jgi:hypothetical protein